MKKIFVLFFIFTLSSCSTVLKVDRTPASLPESLKNLEVLEEVLASEIGEQNAVQLRNNMVKYLIEGAHRDKASKIEIYQQLQRYLTYNMVMFHYDRSFKVVKPPQWTLKSEIAFLNRSIDPAVISDRVIQQEIGVLQPLLDQLTRHQFGSAQGDMLVELVRQSLGSGSVSEVVSEEEILEGFNKFEQKMDPYFNKIRGFGSQLAESPEFTLKNKALETFSKDFIEYYYRHVDEDVIKTITSELIDLGKQASDMARAKVVLRNVGPGLGKTLQQLGKEEGLGPSIQKILEILEEEGKEVPDFLVQDVVHADQGGFVFKSIDGPLGTGTVAQVNKAVLKTGDLEETVALRFIKPGVKQRATEDITLLNQFFSDAESKNVFYAIPNIKKIVANIEEFLSEDLNIEQTIKNQLLAQKFYFKEVKEVIDGDSRRIIFKIPKVFKPLKGKHTQLHIQEFISGGEKFSNLLSNERKEMDFTSRALVRMWLDEALFESGFLHGDLHQGNFKVTLLKEDKKILVTIFDFGMSAMVRPKIQRAFILLGAGAHFGDVKMIHESLRSISPRKLTSEESLHMLAAIKKRMNAGNLSAEQWITWAVKQGYELPTEIGTLARGGALVGQLPKLVGNGEIYSEIAMDLAKKNTFESALSFKKSSPLKFKDFGRISVDFIKNSCQSLFRKFFPKK